MQSQFNWSYFSTSIIGYIINELVIPFQSLGYIALVYGFWTILANSKVALGLQYGADGAGNYIFANANLYHVVLPLAILVNLRGLNYLPWFPLFGEQIYCFLIIG